MGVNKEQDRDGAVGDEVPDSPEVPKRPLNWALALVKQSLLADYEYMRMTYGFEIPPHAYLSKEEERLLGSLDASGSESPDGAGDLRRLKRRIVLECQEIHKQRRLAPPSADGKHKFTRHL